MSHRGTQTSIRVFLVVLTGLIVVRSAVAGGRVATSADTIQPILVGSQVPDVMVGAVEDDDVSLREAVRGKPTVLIFYRGGWCPYCNAQLSGLVVAEQELVGMGYQVLAISADSPETLKTAGAGKVGSHTLLSDCTTKAAQAFGIAFKVEEQLVSLYKNDYGIDLEAASGETHHILPVPAVFLTGADGKISFSYANPDYKVRLSPSILLAAAKAALGE